MDVVSDQKFWYIAIVVTLITFFLWIPHYGPKRETTFEVNIIFYCGKIYIAQNA